jgi:hypothetical protein
MPGCLADATIIVNAFFGFKKVDRISDDEEAGCARLVYRLGDVVYKLDGSIDGDNLREFEVLTYFRDAPWSSPVTLYDVDGTKVLCMPYYENDEPKPYISPNDIIRLEDEWFDWAQENYPNEYPNADFHDGNYRVVNGQIKIIDAAGSAW